MNHYYNPVRVYEGTDCLLELNRLVCALPSEQKNILLLTYSETIQDTESYQTILSQLKDFSVRTLCFSVSNPDVSDLYALYRKTKDWNLQLIIAVGGGSVLDTGKSLCCLFGNQIHSVDELRHHITAKEKITPACRWIGVPTTAGTRSEVTCWATIWDEASNCKLSLENPKNYAYAALIDPRLSLTTPLSLKISSALDAVCHAAESYWANGSNPISKSLSLGAIFTLMKNFPDLLHQPNNLDFQEKTALGSVLAGLAFSNTKTTACHSISYPLTLKYGIPHGVAVSLLLAPVMSVNANVIPQPEQFFAAFQAENAQQAKEKIALILSRAKIPCRLRDWGVPQEDIPELSELCFAKGRMDNNPVVLSRENVIAILNEIF